MNARAALIGERVDVSTRQPAAVAAPARIALLGTGNVGRAVLERLAGWAGTPLADRLQLVHLANSRQVFRRGQAEAGLQRVVDGFSGSKASTARDFCWPDGFNAVAPATSAALGLVASGLGNHGTRIVIDATASDEVASRHVDWLGQGIHVVTACKLGQGTSLARWRAIRSACANGSARYGDSATVGAGLPLLRTIRDLRAGGDRIHAIAGVLSGSLAWLLDRYDGRLPFSGFVREARAAGYTEPDPREDLSGEDVRRKLLILARAAGAELDADAVTVQSLVPAPLAGLARTHVDAGLPMLDGAMRDRYADAWKCGGSLHFVARWQPGRASVGLETLAADDPLAAGAGTDNRVAIWSDRYRDRPLLVQGPGAGAEVTAAALLDDALSFQATPK